MIGLAELERRYPNIPWREPQQMSILETGASGYACRVCVATLGIRGDAIAELPNDPAVVREHIKEAHGG